MIIIGQRLNIEITKGDKVLANAYYHWSAYTSSAASLTALICAAIPSVISSNPTSDIDLAVRLLEATGAGVNGNNNNEVAEFEAQGLDISKYRAMSDRDEGIIAISQQGINDTRAYEEGRSTIDIDSAMVIFDVMFTKDTEDYIKDALGYGGEVNYHTFKACPSFPVDTREFTFEQFVKFTEFVVNLTRNSQYNFYDPEKDVVVDFIE